MRGKPMVLKTVLESVRRTHWISLLAVLLTLSGTARALAQPSDPPFRVARLARDVENVDAIRAVKRLQTAYAQYFQAGLWTELASLFADEGELIYGTDVQGRAAIAR